MSTLTNVTPELVARATGGDALAVRDIVRALERPLFGVALRMLHSREDAEDATQEALLRIVTHLGQYRGEARFSTWAWRIAVHRILDFQKQRKLSLTFAALSADLLDGGEVAAPERAEDAVLYGQLKLVCSRAMLQCLDAEQRIAFILGEILELPGDEAAAILDVEPATYRKRLSRARSALSEFLETHCSLTNPEAPCACHRRADRALALGRVARSSGAPSQDLVQLRRHLSTIGAAKRAAAFYQSEPDSESRRDFVATLRAILTPSVKEPS